MKKINLYILVICLLLGSFSCNEEEFLKEDVRDVLTADNLYSTPEGFENGLNALYELVRNERNEDDVTNDISKSLWNVAMVATDAYYLSRFGGSDNAYTQWGSYMNSSLQNLSSIWAWLYTTINSSNTIIKRAENEDVTWDSDEHKNEVIAQARCIRAWAYRHLTYLWGDVPLSLDESTGSNIKTDWERTAKEDVRKAMEEDWLFAAEYLPDVRTEPGRLSKVVAQHYLAELYLAMDEPEEAETMAQAVINNSNYALITERYGVNASNPGVSFMDQFYEGNVFRNEGNTEVLWEFPYEYGVTGGGANSMRRYWLVRYTSISGVTNIVYTMGRGSDFTSVTNYAFGLYEDSDDRASEYAIHRWFLKDNGDTVFTSVGTVLEPLRDLYRPSTTKWDDGGAGTSNPSSNDGYNDQPYLRLAETYLLLAEAQYRQGKTSDAAETLNVVRRRSHASEITASQVDINFILDERIRELLTEEHRKYTLTRLNKWYERTSLYNHQCGSYIAEYNQLLPIPQDVIDANLDAVMEQNTGY